MFLNSNYEIFIFDCVGSNQKCAGFNMLYF
jgi:hypothetical protein